MDVCEKCGNVAWGLDDQCEHQNSPSIKKPSGDEQVTPHPTDLDTYLVRSRRDPSVTYTVKLFEQFTSCTCTHGLNNQGRAHCYHVADAERYREAKRVL